MIHKAQHLHGNEELCAWYPGEACTVHGRNHGKLCDILCRATLLPLRTLQLRMQRVGAPPRKPPSPNSPSRRVKRLQSLNSSPSRSSSSLHRLNPNNPLVSIQSLTVTTSSSCFSRQNMDSVYYGFQNISAGKIEFQCCLVADPIACFSPKNSLASSLSGRRCLYKSTQHLDLLPMHASL